MILNIALVVLLFGAAKKRLTPYGAAALLGAIKGGIYAVFSKNYVFALIMGLLFFALASGFVFLLARIDRRDEESRPDVPSYTAGGSDKIRLRWEYFPLVVLLLLIVGGEMLLL